MSVRRLSLVCALGLGLTGCAGVDLYSDADLKTQTGIALHPTAKPYLLVTRTGAKDKPIDVSVIYITDTNETVYARPRSGFGSAKTSFALANGGLSTFGQESDAKIPELLASVSGLITARATADKTYADADAVRAAIEQGSDAPALGIKVKAIADDILAKLATFTGLTASETASVASAGQALLAAANNLTTPANAPSAATYIATVKEQAAVLDKLPKATSSTPRDQALLIIAAWVTTLNAVVKDGTPEKPPEATFELYEIKLVKNGATSLVRVPLP